MPRIYVGTYAKYTRGSLNGAWLDLEDYPCKQDFYEACAELHEDEADPEFMFQDHEDIPSMFITECSIDVEFWDYMDCELDDEIKEAYVELKERWNAEDCESSYIGKFYGDTELGEHVVDEHGLLNGAPEELQCYFNYEAYGRDLRLSGDVREHNGHYFWAD